MSITRLNKKWISRFLLPGLSIEQRLPLLLCILLLCGILVFSCASYLGVRKAALEVSRERLYTLIKQLSLIFQQSTNNMATATQTTANNVTVKNTCDTVGKNQLMQKPVDFEGFARAVSELGLYWLLTNQVCSHVK